MTLWGIKGAGHQDQHARNQDQDPGIHGKPRGAGHQDQHARNKGQGTRVEPMGVWQPGPTREEPWLRNPRGTQGGTPKTNTR